MAEEKTPVIAIIALILAIVFPLAGLIVGIIAYNDIKKTKNQTGKGLALAAIIIGAILTLLGLIFAIIFMSAFFYVVNSVTNSSVVITA